MEKPVWILKDKAGKEVWASYDRSYLAALDGALQHLEYELVRGDQEACSTCGLPPGVCPCSDCPTCG